MMIFRMMIMKIITHATSYHSNYIGILNHNVKAVSVSDFIDICRRYLTGSHSLSEAIKARSTPVNTSLSNQLT